MKKSVAALYLAALSLPAASSALAEDLVIPLPGDTTVEKNDAVYRCGAETVEVFQKRVGADHAQRPYCGNVERVAQGFTQAQRPVVLTDVVVICMQSDTDGLRQRCIVDQRGSRPAMLQGQRVEERLEGRAGLPRGANRINLTATRIHPSKHLVCLMIHHQSRRIGNVARAQIVQPAVEDVLDIPLQGRIQGGVDLAIT